MLTSEIILCNLIKESGWNMSYNNNIVLEMLSSTFWDEIENFVEGLVMDFKDDYLWDIFEEPVDYALYDCIEAMKVLYFSTEQKDKTEEIFGRLQIETAIEGYVHWDGENEWVGDRNVCLEVTFDFDVENHKCANLKLVYGLN